MSYRVISPDTEAVIRKWNIPALPAAAIAASGLNEEQIAELLDASEELRPCECEAIDRVCRRLAEARADRFRLRLQRLEVVPFQKNAPLPGHPGRQLAQNAAVGNVSERVEIRLHAVARAQDERARREEQDAAEQKPNAYEPVRFQGDPRW